MHFSLVNASQVVMHAQIVSVLAAMVCGVFSVYLLTVYRTVYPTSSKLVLMCTLLLSVIFLEKTRHMAFACVGELTAAHITVTAIGSCFASMAFGLVTILVIMNHDRLIRTIRHTFSETTSIVRSAKISRLTVTQMFRIIEHSDFDDTLRVLNLINKPCTGRLLKLITVIAWGLIAANICFVIVMELSSHL